MFGTIGKRATDTFLFLMVLKFGHACFHSANDTMFGFLLHPIWMNCL